MSEKKKPRILRFVVTGAMVVAPLTVGCDEIFGSDPEPTSNPVVEEPNVNVPVQHEPVPNPAPPPEAENDDGEEGSEAAPDDEAPAEE